MTMSGKERPLPKPPRTPFGRRRPEEDEEGAPLMADRMAAAMAEGKLEEFMKEEMPDNDYARTLAAMMMGMTGMMPPGGVPAASGEGAGARPGESEETKPLEETTSAVQPPEDVIDTARAGDVKGMMDILVREHRKRMRDAEAEPEEEEKADETSGLSEVERETLNQLIRIASENNVSVDWTILRALKLYILEYQKSGRL